MNKLIRAVVLLACMTSGGAALGQTAEAGVAAAKIIVDEIKSLTGGGPCTRHIYNQSSSDWVFTGSAGSGMCEKGCTIKAGTDIPISYSTTSMSIDLVGPGYHDAFTVYGKGNCVKIDHNGNTGKAVLNDPADGDIAFIN